jgi:hypothetical protein
MEDDVAPEGVIAHAVKVDAMTAITPPDCRISLNMEVTLNEQRSARYAANGGMLPNVDGQKQHEASTPIKASDPVAIRRRREMGDLSMGGSVSVEKAQPPSDCRSVMAAHT